MNFKKVFARIFSVNWVTRVLRRWKLIVFGVLVLSEIFLLLGNFEYLLPLPFEVAGRRWSIVCWHIILPVIVVLTAENAVKLFAVKKLAWQIVCYVVDLVCVITLTVFSNVANGVTISFLYMVLLTEFYLRQEKLVSNIIMGVACTALFLVTVALSGIASGQIGINLGDIGGIISRTLTAILLIALHFVILNFALQMYRKNDKITKALEELNESNEKLQIAYRDLQEITALEERQRIAKDIHDTAGHSITTVIMQTEAAKLVIDADPEDAKRKISAANLQAKHALEELRESVHLLSGTGAEKTLKDLLLEIVHDSSDGTNVTVRYEIDDVELCDAKRRFVLNTLKEGISNGLRHGGATAFWFELKAEDGVIRFLLSDNGAGMDISELKEGFGLSGMHTRAASLGGEVWFETERDEGFEIHMTLPADGDNA